VDQAARVGNRGVGDPAGNRERRDCDDRDQSFPCHFSSFARSRCPRSTVRLAIKTVSVSITPVTGGCQYEYEPSQLKFRPPRGETATLAENFLNSPAPPEKVTVPVKV
jgi:hypothetical protein